MFNHNYDNMLVNALEVFDKSTTRNNKHFQESIKLQVSASRDQFLSNAKNCNGSFQKTLVFGLRLSLGVLIIQTEIQKKWP